MTPSSSLLGESVESNSQLYTEAESDKRDLLQLIWKNSVNRFYVHVVSRLHAIVSKLHDLVSKLNAKIYATYSHFQAKNILVSRFCFQNII
jgi:hypothetical protein